MPTKLEQQIEEAEKAKGPLAWMTRNSVAANLLMFGLIVGGFAALFADIKQEVFPEFELDLVTVSVPYPGASPAEVEQGVLLAIEEEVRGLEGVDEVTSSATEGMGSVTVELLLGTDPDRALSDVKAAVDRITSFPQDVERPVVSLVARRNQVVSLVIYGDLPEKTLRAMAEDARDALVNDKRVTLVELSAVRPLEISINVPQEQLRRHNLTLEGIAQRIRSASVELPGGGVKTPGGEVLLRTTERRDVGREYESVVLRSTAQGTQLRVKDVAEVDDSFRDNDVETRFFGESAAIVQVFRVGDETPTEVSQAVRDYIDKMEPTLPAGVKMARWVDSSETYQDRVDLLMRNGRLGLILVLIVLALFLESRLAFWVTLGIPISFIGSLIFLPMFDVSINMISLFAFIITLGIVVDDAIVVGEAVYRKREEGMGSLHAAIYGVREVAVPVFFSVTTTVVAFSPLLFVPGAMGKFFRNIPLVIIAVLLLSLVESLYVLPAHLAHIKGKTASARVLRWIAGYQERFTAGLHHFIEHRYQRQLVAAVSRRYLTICVAVALFLGSVGIVAGGHIDRVFIPKIESDIVTASVRMPFGTAAADTKKVVRHLERALQETIDANGGESIARGILAQVATSSAFGGPGGNSQNAGSHLGQVLVFLVPSDQREARAGDIAAQWRERVGEVAGVDTMQFRFSTGPTGGADMTFELSHRDLGTLEAASGRLAEALLAYEGVRDVDDGFQPGKEQLDLKVRPGALALGLTERDLGRQVRSAFFGVEATRQQRGRNEVRAYVRLPESERSSEYGVEQLVVRTPQGGDIPLGQAATIKRGRSYTSIRRVDGRRVVLVTGEIVPGKANANKVVASMTKDVLPGLLADYPGLSFRLTGRQQDQRESMTALGVGFLMALLGIYILLAVVFRSYIQPVVIMLAIPFGFVGALLGHVLMGFNISIISMMGLVALSGIVVNDSLILIVAINTYRKEGMSALDAVLAGGVRRFRPILLTSLTTFFGLVPMILETSVQARFLIPMAISLAFGVLVATFIILLLVPSVYLVIEEDVKPWVLRMLSGSSQAEDVPVRSAS